MATGKKAGHVMEFIFAQQGPRGFLQQGLRARDPLRPCAGFLPATNASLYRIVFATSSGSLVSRPNCHKLACPRFRGRLPECSSLLPSEKFRPWLPLWVAARGFYHAARVVMALVTTQSDGLPNTVQFMHDYFESIRYSLDVLQQLLCVFNAQVHVPLPSEIIPGFYHAEGARV